MSSKKLLLLFLILIPSTGQRLHTKETSLSCKSFTPCRSAWTFTLPTEMIHSAALIWTSRRPHRPSKMLRLITRKDSRMCLSTKQVAHHPRLMSNKSLKPSVASNQNQPLAGPKHKLTHANMLSGTCLVVWPTCMEIG